MSRKRGRRSAPAQKPAESAAPEQADAKPVIKNDDTHIRVSVLIFTAAGIAAGLLSLALAPAIGNLPTALAAVIIGWVVSRVVQLLLGKKDIKWLIGNGLFIYIFVWLVSWIFFFNLLA